MRKEKAWAIALVVIIIAIGLSVSNQLRVDVVSGCKVTELQQQQIIEGSKSSNVSTEIRYLVITDKETFICKNSLVNLKFNKEDIFFHLKKDSTYTFRVAGYGKSFFYNYRNILEVVK